MAKSKSVKLPPCCEAAVLAEREACAAICDELGRWRWAAESCARNIRARTTKRKAVRRGKK